MLVTMTVDPADTSVLLHLCTPGDWRSFLHGGAIAPPSLDEAGFVHLSAPEQVALPAERLFAGRTDLVLLVVDPERIGAAGIDVRWEPGVPTDPASMRFPHAYGAVPASAVLAVLPYRPGPDGFAAPDVPVPDVDFRAVHWEPSVHRRAAAVVEPVTGGVAIRTQAYPASRMHNRVLVDSPHLTDVDTLAADVDRTVTGHGLPASVLLWGTDARGLASGLAAAGWEVHAYDVLAGPSGKDPSGVAARVAEVGLDDVRAFRLANWTAALPEAAPEERAQLVDRATLDAQVVATHHLAVIEDGAVVASASCKRDGATAWIDALETAPAHRGRGHGTALLARAREIAAGHGCDLVALRADVADWPRDWFLRNGFEPIGTHIEAGVAG